MVWYLSSYLWYDSYWAELSIHYQCYGMYDSYSQIQTNPGPIKMTKIMTNQLRMYSNQKKHIRVYNCYLKDLVNDCSIFFWGLLSIYISLGISQWLTSRPVPGPLCMLASEMHAQRSWDGSCSNPGMGYPGYLYLYTMYIHIYIHIYIYIQKQYVNIIFSQHPLKIGKPDE